MDAIYGLSLARVVEPAIVAQVTPEFLMTQPPVVAAAATCLLARHAEPKEVLTIVERVAHSAKHRALLLVAAIGLVERDLPVAAQQLIDLLPDAHPARKVLDLMEGDALPAYALDDLGSVRVRKAVGSWLGLRLAKPPARVKTT